VPPKGTEKWGVPSPFLFLLPPLSSPFPFPSLPCPPFPLEVGPLKSSYVVWGSAVSSSSGVWAAAPPEIEFGAF